MVLTFSIRKGYEIVLEVTACEQVFSEEVIPILLQKCFERVFQIISNKERLENNEVILGQESEDEDSTE